MVTPSSTMRRPTRTWPSSLRKPPVHAPQASQRLRRPSTRHRSGRSPCRSVPVTTRKLGRAQAGRDRRELSTVPFGAERGSWQAQHLGAQLLVGVEALQEGQDRGVGLARRRGGRRCVGRVVGAGRDARRRGADVVPRHRRRRGARGRCRGWVGAVVLPPAGRRGPDHRRSWSSAPVAAVVGGGGRGGGRARARAQAAAAASQARPAPSTISERARTEPSPPGPLRSPSPGAPRRRSTTVAHAASAHSAPA